MVYKEYPPDRALVRYIAAYWQVWGDDMVTQREKILPDECVDIIFNLGADFHTDEKVISAKKAFLVGTMTRCKEPVMHAGTKLFGIRFRPAAFSAFFKFDSLRHFTDHSLDFDMKLAPSLDKIIKLGIPYLDRFFLDRFTSPKHPLIPVIDTIQQHKGNITIDALMKSHYITGRQLERHFNVHLGVSPKEFTSFVRFHYAMEMISRNDGTKTLYDIALDAGYHDHAHLTHAIRKYTGAPPSQLTICRISTSR